jgi:hypothetical protein
VRGGHLGRSLVEPNDRSVDHVHPHDLVTFRAASRNEPDSEHAMLTVSWLTLSHYGRHGSVRTQFLLLKARAETLVLPENGHCLLEFLGTW